MLVVARKLGLGIDASLATFHDELDGFTDLQAL
jgi:hypothetical protein